MPSLGSVSEDKIINTQDPAFLSQPQLRVVVQNLSSLGPPYLRRLSIVDDQGRPSESPEFSKKERAKNVDLTLSIALQTRIYMTGALNGGSPFEPKASNSAPALAVRWKRSEQRNRVRPTATPTLKPTVGLQVGAHVKPKHDLTQGVHS